MYFRVLGGLWFVFEGLNLAIGLGVPAFYMGVLALLAGVALLAGK